MKINVNISIKTSDVLSAQMKAEHLAKIADLLTEEQLEQIVPILKSVKQKVEAGASAFALSAEGMKLIGILKKP